MKAGEFPDGHAHPAGEDRHGAPELQHARPGHVPHPARANTTTRATSGASTRCTTMPTANPIRLRASRTRSARWSSRTTARCTTGTSQNIGIYRSAADRIRPAQSHLYGSQQAAADSTRAQRNMLTAGTIRGCRPSPACAAAATRPRRSANSASGSASRNSNGLIDISWLEDALREDLNKTAPRVMGVLRPLKCRDRELSRRSDRGTGSGQQPGRPGGRQANRAVLAVLYIEQRRFPRRPAEGFLPPRRRAGSPVALRLLREMRRRDERRPAAK